MIRVILFVVMYVNLRISCASTSQVIGARNEMMMDDYEGQMIFGDLVRVILFVILWPDTHGALRSSSPRWGIAR